MNRRTGLLAAATVTTALMSSSALADTTLTFWSMWNEQEPQAKALQEIMAAYSAAHPDVTFEVAWNGRQNQVKLRAALQAGTEVDFMDQDGDQLAGGLAKAGLGLPLNDYLSAELQASFLPQVLEFYEIDGQIVQLPYIYNTMSFWYNKTLMADLGLEAPESVDALMQACRTAADNDVSFLVTEGNVGDYTLFHFTYALQRLAGSSALVDIIADQSGESWRSDTVRTALETVKAMWDNDCFSPDVRGFQYPAGQQTIPFDESVAELVGSWLPAELSKSTDPDFQWGSFGYPPIEGGSGSANDLQASLLTLMVLKDAPNAEAAADFLSFIVSKEGQEIMSTTAGVGTVRQDVEWGKDIHDGYQLAKAAEAILPYNGGSSVKYPEFHTTSLSPTYVEFFLGQISADEFVEQMVEKTKAFWKNQ